jgi:acetyltransferase
MKSLDAIFSPKSVAVIGATEKEGSVGRTILWNLISNPFGGTIYPVNIKRSNVLGIKAYPDISSVPEQVDLAVIVTPAPTVPAIIKECVNAKVKGAIIISAGFKEIGKEGAKLERQILNEARKGNMPIIGPNCLGVMRPYFGLNATFATTLANPGNVGFISQSGALCTAVLDWSFAENVGFSAFISIGSMLDVDWGDLIYYLSDDPRTKSIVIYMESVGDARSFISAAREVASTKPIIIIKAGQTEAAAKAASSHTGALTGSDEVLNAAFRRCGILRVNSIAELFYMAEVLGKQPPSKGSNLTILTNAGGPGVLATDALINGGGKLTQMSDKTMKAFNEFLPPHWSRNNPVDILGDADPNRYAKSLEIAAKDPNSDGLLVILTPQAMTEPTQTAEQLKPYAKSLGKPVLASWMGGVDVQAGTLILNQADIPTFPYPDTAARVFNYMWKYSYNLQGLYETPILPPRFDEMLQDRKKEASKIIKNVQKTGRILFTEWESKKILSIYGIPTVKTEIAQSPEEAAKIAKKFGYPVVLKLNSETITHKTDVGGVKLNLYSKDEVTSAFNSIKKSVSAKHFQGVAVQPMVTAKGYEIILGSTDDFQFGPILLFGTGGQLVEVFKDRSLALPPLNTTLARRMIEQTKIYQAFKGVRGEKPVDLTALEQLMVNFSFLVVEQHWIKEIDINPLLVSSENIIALDARIILHDPKMSEDQLPQAAIRPYPTQYIFDSKLRDGSKITIRPIRPEDEPDLVRFHEQLSDLTVYYRYMHQITLTQRIAHERLARICFIDYDREMALVVEKKNPKSKQIEIIAVGRLSKIHGTNDAEFAIVISDKYQRQGLGTELMKKLIDIGKLEKIDRIVAELLPDNAGMTRVMDKVGFRFRNDIEKQVVIAERKL